MGQTEGQRYLKSPALIVSEEREGKYILADITTNKKYELDPDAYMVLNMLESPATFEDVHAAVPAADPETLRGYLEHLRRIALVIDPDDDAPRDFVQISRHNVRMFNASEYDESLGAGNIVITGIPFGRGNPVPNHTDTAPQALRNMTNAMNIDMRAIGRSVTLEALYDAVTDFSGLRNMVKHGRLYDWGDLYIHSHEPARNVYHRISRLATFLFENGQIPFFLGGDHSITYPIIKACSESHPGLHVIHIDAHTDTYSHRTDAIYNAASHHHGNFATRCMELPDVQAFHQFGIRGLNNIGEPLANDKQKIFFIGDARRIISGDAVAPLPDDVPYYVTLDIDAIDPVYAPGTNSPVPGGFSHAEIFQLLTKILPGKRIVGCDLVEIDPRKDQGNCTVQIGLELLLFMLSLMVPEAETASGSMG